MKKSILITGALLITATASIFAADQTQNTSVQMGNNNRPTFVQLDANADGMLVKEELRGRLLANFDQFDTDANGSLSAEEFNSRINMGKQGQKGDRKNRPTFTQLDANSDGMLAKGEVGGRLLANFDQVDTDANGTISAEEFNSRVKMGKKGQKGDRKNRPTFEQLDANSDGMLAKEEVGGRLLANFAQVDTDANGTISAEEFNSRIKMGKQGHRGHKGKHKNRPTFEQLDANSDGMLVKEEVRGRLLANFDQIDTDSNDSLSADEFNSRAKMGKDGQRRNRPTFEQLDANGDGSISAEEYNAGPKMAK